MAYIQPALPGGSYAPPLPWPDGVPAPPGAVLVAQGPIPPPPPFAPPLPGYQPTGLGGMIPAPPPLPGFWPTATGDGGGTTAAAFGALGATAAIAGPFAPGGVPLFVLVLGAILAAFLLFLFLRPLIDAFVKGTTSFTSLFVFLIPLLLIGGFILVMACSGGGGGQSWLLFGALAVMLLIFLPLFTLFPSISTLLTP